jgi:hypothetical protein
VFLPHRGALAKLLDDHPHEAWVLQELQRDGDDEVDCPEEDAEW